VDKSNLLFSLSDQSREFIVQAMPPCADMTCMTPGLMLQKSVFFISTLLLVMFLHGHRIPWPSTSVVMRAAHSPPPKAYKYVIFSSCSVAVYAIHCHGYHAGSNIPVSCPCPCSCSARPLYIRPEEFRCIYTVTFPRIARSRARRAQSASKSQSDLSR
jgi:hypothetical protein